MNRRNFLEQTAASLALVALGGGTARGLEDGQKSGSTPWFRRLTRWGQTNITEIDPTQYDLGWWRKHWQRTATQGVIINAGGIVAYYPSQVPFHQPAQYLANRDLFGEICRAAHEDGIAVFARMDSNRAHEDFFRAHPEYFAVNASGQPHKAGELFVACVNGPYYETHIPAILREIIERYHPEGFTDNSWSGLGRGNPCFCDNCRTRFREKTGEPIPIEKNWNDPIYREWIRWNYRRRLELWDLNNRVTQAAGGPDCIWVGMNSGSISGQCQSFRDYREICRRAPIIMLDHQARSDNSGFQNNGETGKLIHGLLGWDKLIPESTAMYQAGRPTFRLSSKPEAEARLWMLEGIAGGLQPWWHHVGAYHEDRRMYETVSQVNAWHKKYKAFLVNRQPIATVGVVWSQENTDFYGRDDVDALVELPWRGMTQALIRARIPYLPVHVDQIDEVGGEFSLLILPNLGAMSDAQLIATRRFVQKGGGLLATGESSLFNESGEPRRDFALADLFGAHLMDTLPTEAERRKRAQETQHTYLRLSPELRARVDGPHLDSEPAATTKRHPVLAGFEETDIVAFGGILNPIKVETRAEVVMTFIPAFPIYPPETAWMRQPKTNIPGLVLNTTSHGARVAYLAADLDRRYGRDNLPDHGNLIANLVRWAAKDNLPLLVEGRGLIDCHIYRQPSRAILHLVNLTNPGAWRQPVEELIPVGPLKIRLRLPQDVRGHQLNLLASNERSRVVVEKGWAAFELHSLLDHEVAVVT